MYTKHETNFVVMPKDCNYMDIIFGGYFMSQMDLCAATCVAKLLWSSETANKAVTHMVKNLVFHKPAHKGDVVYLKAEITELRKKGICVKIRSEKESRNEEGRVFVAEGEFVFVSMNGDNYVNHGLSLEVSQ